MTKRRLRDIADYKGVNVMVEVGVCVLQIDVRRCKGCETCEGLLPGFKSKNQGILLISAANMEREEILEAVSCVMGHCPEMAISLLPYPFPTADDSINFLAEELVSQS